MSPATVYYLSGLAILFGINLIAIWGLDLQFGLAGINSFAFIIFQAAGAYVTGAPLAQAGQAVRGGSRPTSAGPTCPCRCRSSAAALVGGGCSPSRSA